MPYPAAPGQKRRGRGSGSRESTPALLAGRNDAASAPLPSTAGSSRVPTPMASTSSNRAETARSVTAPALSRPTPISFTEWSRLRYGFLDPAETSRYKIDGSTLGIDPECLSFEWDEDELWDAFEDRYGSKERDRVAKGEEGEDEAAAEGEDSTDESEYDDDDDGGGVETDEGVNTGRTRLLVPSSPPPRARMAFSTVAIGGEQRMSSSAVAGTEAIARLCHLASATEGAIVPSARLAALAQLGTLYRAAVVQVPWRWRSLEEGKGRARGGTGEGAGADKGKGTRWATRNPFMRGTKADERGRGARRPAKFSLASETAAAVAQEVDSLQALRGARPAPAQRDRRARAAQSQGSSSAVPSRASSVGPAAVPPAVRIGSPATATSVNAPPSGTTPAMSALYRLPDDEASACVEDLATAEGGPRATVPVGAGLAPAPRRVPHAGTSHTLGSPPTSRADLSSASGSSSTRLMTLGKPSAKGAVGAQSVHEVSLGVPTPPPSGRDDLFNADRGTWDQEEGDAAGPVVSSDAEALRYSSSSGPNPPLRVRPLAATTSPTSGPLSPPPASSSGRAAKSGLLLQRNSARDQAGGAEDDSDDGEISSASSSGPELIAARLLRRSPAASTSATPVRAPTAPVAGPTGLLLRTPPPKLPTVSRASTPSGMVVSLRVPWTGLVVSPAHEKNVPAALHVPGVPVAVLPPSEGDVHHESRAQLPPPRRVDLVPRPGPSALPHARSGRRRRPAVPVLPILEHERHEHETAPVPPCLPWPAFLKISTFSHTTLYL